MLLHGREDTNVPLRQTLALRDAVTARGGTVRCVILDGEGHIVRGRDARVRYLEEIVRWFVAHLHC